MTVCFFLIYKRLIVHPIHRITVSVIVTMLGVWFYDLIWLFGIYNQHISLPRLTETLLLLAILLFYNYFFKFHFIQVNKTFFGALVCFSVTMMCLGMSGWYKVFNYWAIDQTLPDPHNWLWAVSKVTGILMWTTLIKNGKD